MGLWRNGSACGSRSQGWAFESLWPHEHPSGIEPVLARGCAKHSLIPSDVKPQRRKMGQRECVRLQTTRLGVRFSLPHRPLAQQRGNTIVSGGQSNHSRPFLTPKNSLGLWRNGSACDSRSQGWAFESLWPHEHPAGIEPEHACGCAGQLVSRSGVEPHHRENGATGTHTTPDHTVGSSIPAGHAFDQHKAGVSQACSAVQENV